MTYDALCHAGGVVGFHVKPYGQAGTPIADQAIDQSIPAMYAATSKAAVPMGSGFATATTRVPIDFDFDASGVSFAGSTVLTRRRPTTLVKRRAPVNTNTPRPCPLVGPRQNGARRTAAGPRRAGA